MVNALFDACYIGAQLGPGPRDGLMTGLHRRTGMRIAPVRLGLEAVVLAAGWLLGGPVGVGTVAYALTMGPIVHWALPHCVVRVREPGSSVASPATPTR